MGTILLKINNFIKIVGFILWVFVGSWIIVGLTYLFLKLGSFFSWIGVDVVGKFFTKIGQWIKDNVK